MGLQRVRLPLLVSLVVLAFSSPVGAADSNGYSAQYECRAGGPNCNVDVAALAALPCDQIIKTGTSPTNSWSAINWANNVICIEVGDHAGRGELSLGSSGAAGARKVLRGVTASGGVPSDPWSDSARAAIQRLTTNDHDYWVISRLSSDHNGSDVYRMKVTGGSSHVIVDRVLIENYNSGGSDDALSIGTSISSGGPTWVQNSRSSSKVGLANRGVPDHGRGSRRLCNHAT